MKGKDLKRSRDVSQSSVLQTQKFNVIKKKKRFTGSVVTFSSVYKRKHKLKTNKQKASYESCLVGHEA